MGFIIFVVRDASFTYFKRFPVDQTYPQDSDLKIKEC